MNLPAYRGDHDRKRQLLQRLRELAEADRWVDRPMYWNGDTGSLIGSLLQSEMVDAWEDVYGLPKWLALALDGQFIAAPDDAEGVRAGIALLEAIAPGADLSVAGNRCLLEFLQGPSVGLSTQAVPGPLAEVLDRVAGLHQARIHGQTVEAAQWRQARRAAMEATNALPPNTPEATVGACIEAAAWEPATSRTAVSDTLRIWGWVMRGTAQVPATSNMPDMSDEEHARIRALLQRLYEDAKAERGDDAHIDVLKLASEKHPEVYARMRANNAWKSKQERRHFEPLWQSSVDVMRAALTAHE